jgi:hypothetical protein
MITRTLLGTLVAVLLGLATSDTLQGSFGGHPWLGGSRYTPSYYYPVPAVPYYYYTPAPLYVGPGPYCPGPAVQLVPMYAPNYAKPTPAPPSQTKEPPLGKSGSMAPTVIESRAFAVNDITPMKTADAGVKDVCKVGFWNVSGADVKLIVDGKTHVIPTNRSLTLTLNRQFTYQINARAPQAERVSDAKTEHEIVIR